MPGVGAEGAGRHAGREGEPGEGFEIRGRRTTDLTRYIAIATALVLAAGTALASELDYKNLSTGWSAHSPAKAPVLRGEALKAYPYHPISCGASGGTSWYSTSPLNAVILQCRMWLPDTGSALITADASLARFDGEYEAGFMIGVNSLVGDADTERYVNIYDDAGDGGDQVVATSVMMSVSTGWHTFYFLGRRLGGAGTVTVYDPTLTAVFIPFGMSELSYCYSHGINDWSGTSSDFGVMDSCSLGAPATGVAFISASGTAALADAEYEGQFSLDVDSIQGDSEYNRWINVYSDAGNGSDRTLAITAIVLVDPGVHEFNFLGSRLAGTGTVFVHNTSVGVIFIPLLEGYPAHCTSTSNLSWTTTSSSFEVVKQCEIYIPTTEPGKLLITADATMAHADGEYEARIRIGIDSTEGDDTTDRWVNVYGDAGDGTDTTVALSVLKPIAAGIHTVYLLARRESGPGRVWLLNATLNVIQVETALFFDDFETGDLLRWSSYVP